MFLVTGITGHVGGATARGLLTKGKQVRALVRNAKKAEAWAATGVELVQGDWNDASSIATALNDVEGAYIMMPPTQTPSPGFPEARAIVANYAQALRQTPPPKLVALSSFGSEKTSGLGLITATHLLEQGLNDMPFPVALVRAGGFIENFTYGLQAAQGGTLPVFYAPTSRKVGQIATADIGALVVELLTTDWSGRRVIELGTPISPDEIAAAIGQVLGREVKAQPVPREAWAGAIEHMGLPKGSTWAYEEMLEGVNSGWIDFGTEGTEKRPGTTAAREVFAQAQVN